MSEAIFDQHVTKLKWDILKRRPKSWLEREEIDERCFRHGYDKRQEFIPILLITKSCDRVSVIKFLMSSRQIRIENPMPVQSKLHISLFEQNI
jgi:hypothetical protein